MATTTLPDQMPGTRRAVPTRPRPGQVEQLRRLLHQSEHWVRRPDWDDYLDERTPPVTCPISGFTAGQCVGALAWLRQQRHALHRVVEGSTPAPDGWLEGLPLHQALERAVEERETAFVHDPPRRDDY